MLTWNILIARSTLPHLRAFALAGMRSHANGARNESSRIEEHCERRPFGWRKVTPRVCMSEHFSQGTCKSSAYFVAGREMDFDSGAGFPVRKADDGVEVRADMPGQLLKVPQ